MKEHYTYGDNDGAARRLALLANAYEPSSRRLLESLARVRRERAVDLGCGPGFTTELARQVLGAGETWGLDASERLVARARERWAACIFAVHDATTHPLPTGSVDVFYARYLLTHVASPASVLAACAAAAAPGCTLVLEEGCGLESDDALFTGYYGRVEAMHRHYGQDLYVGRRLPAIAAESGAGWRVERYERAPLVLDARVMAQLHALNVRTWGGDPYAVAAFDAGELASMTEALDAVADGWRSAPPVTCTMGQLVATWNG
jgi:trans-aconitate 2-methyltransferase